VSAQASPTERAALDARRERAIATLGRELPYLFQRDISYELYTWDIWFQDPVNTFQYKFNYRLIFWTLRFHARLFFRAIAFELHAIWAEAPQLIQASWTVRGTPRLPWPAQVCFSGRSSYKLDRHGRIYAHIDTWDRSPRAVLKQFLPAAR